MERCTISPSNQLLETKERNTSAGLKEKCQSLANKNWPNEREDNLLLDGQFFNARDWERVTLRSYVEKT